MVRLSIKIQIMSPFGLEEQTINKLNEKLESFLKIEKVSLYGSRAKGGLEPKSDINLALVASGLSLSGLS